MADKIHLAWLPSDLSHSYCQSKGKQVSLFGLIEDLIERQASRCRPVYRARTDSLTRQAHRVEFHPVLDRGLRVNRRPERAPPPALALGA